MAMIVKSLLRRILPFRLVKSLRSFPTVRLPRVLESRRRLAREIESVYRTFVFPDLPERERRSEYLEELIGTGPSEAMYILEELHRSLRVGGDVCELGVAQGATSALLANELLETDRHLWLFDSFEGLPAPTEKDLLIDDIFGLGSMARYRATMAYGPEELLRRLAGTGLARERTHVVKGYIEQIPLDAFPPSICFAYIDMDLYQPIAYALEKLDARLSVGGSLVVDDYDFFSSGVKSAVDEFLAARPGAFAPITPPAFAGHFLVLRKIGPAPR